MICAHQLLKTCVGQLLAGRVCHASELLPSEQPSGKVVCIRASRQVACPKQSVELQTQEGRGCMHVVRVDRVNQSIDDSVTSLEHRHHDQVGHEDLSIGDFYDFASGIGVKHAQVVESGPRLDQAFEAIG